jgi:hypothetical protein
MEMVSWPRDKYSKIVCAMHFGVHIAALKHRWFSLHYEEGQLKLNHRPKDCQYYVHVSKHICNIEACGKQWTAVIIEI